MDEICDRCGTGNCVSCELNEGSISQKLKKQIASRLTNFLLSEKQNPSEVVIYVRYEHSTARLNLKLDGTAEIMREAGA